LNKEVSAMPISLAAAAQTYRVAARDAVRRHSSFHLVQAAMLITAPWLIGLMPGLDRIAIGAALGAMAWRLRGQAATAA
jgi:hypothetical protein